MLKTYIKKFKNIKWNKLIKKTKIYNIKELKLLRLGIKSRYYTETILKY